MGLMSRKDMDHLRSGAWCDQVGNTFKGKFGGKCNRTACTERGERVKWWNTGTRAYYCTCCRNLITRANPEITLFDPVAHIAHGQPGTASDTAAPSN